MPIKRVGPNKRLGWVILSKFHKRVGLNKGNSRKAVLNKRVGWKIGNQVGWIKCK